MKLSKAQNEWLTAMLEYPSNVVEETNPQLAKWLEKQLHAARLEAALEAFKELDEESQRERAAFIVARLEKVKK